MRQRKRFLRPVRKATSDDLIEVGDTVIVILKDGSNSGETVTSVQDRGYWIEWNNAINKTRQEDVTTLATQHFVPCSNLTDSGEYWRDIEGNLILDLEGNPIPILT